MNHAGTTKAGVLFDLSVFKQHVAPSELNTSKHAIWIYSIQWALEPPSPETSKSPKDIFRRHAKREVQTVNSEGGGERAVERGVESGLKKAHKPWIRGKKGVQTVNWGGAKPWSANHELGTFSLKNSSVSVHSLHFMVCAPLNFVKLKTKDVNKVKHWTFWCPRFRKPKQNIAESISGAQRFICLPNSNGFFACQQTFLVTCGSLPPFYGRWLSILGPVLHRMDFCGFFFLSRRFVLVLIRPPDFVSSFVGRNAQTNLPIHPRQKRSINQTCNKNLQHISADWPVLVFICRFPMDLFIKSRWERKGRFRKRVVLANVPSFGFRSGEHANVPLFRFSFRGNIRMYPRSGFRSGGTSAKTTLLETTLLGTPENQSAHSWWWDWQISA